MGVGCVLKAEAAIAFAVFQAGGSNWESSILNALVKRVAEVVISALRGFYAERTSFGCNLFQACTFSAK